MAEFSFDGIGTGWSIITPDPLPDGLVTAIQLEVETFDRAYSRFRPDSPITALARSGGTVEFPETAADLFAFYRELFDLTDGAVTPLVGGALDHLGYDPEYSLRRRPGAAEVAGWDDVLQIDGAVVTLTRPAVLDLGAAGKGRLVDLIGARLTAAGLTDFVVDGSGDLLHHGPQGWRVGLEDPHDPQRVIGVADVRDGALCGSAINRRRWGPDLHHVIDPATGEPTNRYLATWTTAESAMVSDGLATALFFVDPTTLATRFDFSYVRLPATGGIEYSRNFNGELFT